jgi:hypothetical protein
MRKYTFSALRWAGRAHLALFRPHIAVAFFTLGVISIACCIASIILCLELQIGTVWAGAGLELLGTSCTDKTMTSLYAALGIGQLMTGGLLWEKAQEEKDQPDLKRKVRI